MGRATADVAQAGPRVYGCPLGPAKPSSRRHPAGGRHRLRVGCRSVDHHPVPTLRASWRAALRKPSLLTRFGVLSFVLIVALGAVLAVRLEGALRDRTLADAIQSAEVAASVGLQPLLEPGDLTSDFAPLPADRKAALDDSLQGSISTDGIVRLKVWNRQHWLVYSDNQRLVGRWFPGSDQLEAAFDGRTTSEVTDLRAPEELEERDFGTLLAVYVPLRVDGDGSFTNAADAEVVGSFEIYLPYKPIAAAIAADTRQLHVTLAIGLLVLYAGVFQLVARASRTLRRQARDNQHQALHDALTGLPNRTLFTDRVASALAVARRTGAGVAVMLLDLDRFKEVNDTFGHRSGDVLLQEVGRRLRGRMREVDTVARLGGDEFALVLTGVEHVADAAAVADDLRELLEQPFRVGQLDLDIRASIGTALYPAHGEDPDELLRHADVAMYVAKSAHSEFEAYQPDLDHYRAERLELAADVRRALEQDDEIVLAFQPQLDLATGRIASVEALVRWQHPSLGLVPPSEFMPVIEGTELMRPLTARVLALALDQLRAWTAAGIDIGVAVNLSARNVNDLRLPDELARALTAAGVDPSSLELELTESSVVDSPVRAARVLGEIHDLGVRLAIDDFGTGYASVASLSGLPFDALKVDQSFVRQLTTGGQGSAIVRFSIELGHDLGLAVVAEGVEDDATLDALRTLGCDLAQGYLIGRPQPAAELTPRLVASAEQVAR